MNLAENKETSEEEMVHEILFNLIGFNTQNLEPLLLYFISLSLKVLLLNPWFTLSQSTFMVKS